MKTSDFDYYLPSENIAQRPADKRDHSSLLHLPLDGSKWADYKFHDIPKLLVEAGVKVMVFNDTKVIPARLFGTKPTGGKVELLLLEPDGHTGSWSALAKASKPLKPGTSINFEEGFAANVTAANEGGEYVVDFGGWENSTAAIEKLGVMPLPPYIRREQGGSQELRTYDRQRYQTVYAKNDGAVAAPTAGLHFTEHILKQIDDAGITRVFLTLHVGAGTFMPLRTENPLEHEMHTERYTISEQAAAVVNQAKANGDRVIAVGTTSCRALEAATDENGQLQAKSDSTNIFIMPGYRFKIIDGLITNFHLPKSTLLMLVSALAGRERILAAYEHAVEEGYRFYSYGDSMAIL